ncbi:MAG: CHAT domain-containing protein, partial [Candidatus Eremiobacteraeota bacterium]|nr:CHAT domain-containing protein [Candidatus Eremiobacteraeota bacterium]
MLDLPPDEAPERMREIVENMDEPAFVVFHNTMLLASSSAFQRAGLNGITDPAEFERRVGAYRATAPSDARRFERITALRGALDQIRMPAEAAAHSEDELRFVDACTAIGDRFLAVMKRSSIGTASLDAVAELEAVVADYRALLSAADPANRERRRAEEMLAGATEQTAITYALLRRYADARTWYEQALQAYRALSDESGARKCAQRLDALHVLTTADVDDAVRTNLESLLRDDAQPGSLDRAVATVGLMSQALEVGDTYQAGELVAAAVGELAAQQYSDPGFDDVQLAFAAWVDAVPSTLQGNPFFAVIAKVVQLETAIFGARSMICTNTGRAGDAARAHAQLERLGGLVERMIRESQAASKSIEADFAELSGPAFAAVGFAGAGQGGGQGVDAKVEAAHRGIEELGRGLTRLRDEKTRRIESGEPLDDLLPQVIRLEADADRLDQIAYAAYLRMLRAEILNAMERSHEALAALNEARVKLKLAFAAAGPAADNAPERTIDIEILSRIAATDGTLGDFSAASAAFGEAIEQIERDRYKVNSPYQQSAFLNQRADIYRYGVGLAYKLGDYETMLQRAELSKARGLSRARYETAAPALELSGLERQFRDICDAIDAERTVAGSEKLSELLERRRRMWDLMAIARRSSRTGGADIPAFSVADVQRALEPDEAVLYYYWVSPTILLVIAVDQGGFTAERTILTGEDVAALDDVLVKLRSLKWGDLDAAVGKLSAQLFPVQAAALLDGKRRLIISPHRKLHLLPFHALPWKEGLLVDAFAVSYTPNLSIVAAPGRAAAKPKVLIMGSKDFAVPGVALPSLEGVDVEVRGVADTYRHAGIEADVLTDERLTRAELQRRSDDGSLATYSCLHLATHGESVLDVENTPMESRLFLHDAALDGLEISNLRLNADVVVLSACDSGQRAIAGRGMTELGGDDLFGIQAAFSLAGARCVLGSLWPVYDDVTATIMMSFHRYLTQLVAPEIALQSAVLDY